MKNIGRLTNTLAAILVVGQLSVVELRAAHQYDGLARPFYQLFTPDSSKVETDRQREGLLGSVQTVKTAMQIVESSEEHKETTQAFMMVTTFDVKGSMIRAENAPVFKMLGLKIPWKSRLVFEKKDSDSYSYEEDGTLRRKYHQTYRDDGSVESESVTLYDKKDESASSTFQYFYDTAGRVTERTHYKSDGSIISRSKYIYDDHGNPVKRFDPAVDPTGTQSPSIMSYDEKNRLIEKIRQPSGEKTVFHYNQEGNRIEEIHYNSDGSIDDFFGRSVTAHNERGDITEYARYGADGVLRHRTTTTYDYNEFDDVGNWIEKIETAQMEFYSKDGAPPTATKITTLSHRTITYYKNK